MMTSMVKGLSQLQVRKDIVEVLIGQTTLRLVLKIFQVSIAMENDGKPASWYANSHTLHKNS